jgi:hypothetical protein
MKTCLLTILALALAAAAPAADKPAVDALRAAKIATDFLAQQGAGAPHIVSIALESSAIIKPQASWVVRWSKPIVSDGATEVGLRVKSDGSITRLVENKHARSTRAPAALDIR